MYNKLPEDQYKKLKFQLRGQFMAILNPFRVYGLDHDVDVAIEECVLLADKFGQAVRGDSKPIHILSKPKPRITE